MKNYLSNLASTLQGIAGVISDGERVQHAQKSYAMRNISYRINFL